MQTRLKISALWVVIMFNIAFADIVGFIHPGTLEKIIEGSFGFPVTPELLLVFSILLEIPIIMIVLCLTSPARANRWLNTLAVTLTTLFVVGGGSATYSYVFFAAVEILCMLVIMWLVWKADEVNTVAEKISALGTQSYLQKRAMRASDEAFDKVMAAVPDVPADVQDELPKDLRAVFGKP